jgi:hypothetical protein
VTVTDGAETGPAADDDRLRAFRERATTRRQQQVRANLSLLLVYVDLFMVAMVAAHVHGPARVLGGLTFCIVVPGWSMVGLLRLNRAPLELGLTVAAGLAALTVLGQLATTVGGWHLPFLQLLICGLCLPPLLWQALTRPRRAGSQR